MDFKEKIRVIEDFPKAGISFKDISTLIADKDALRASVDRMAEFFKDKEVDVVVGPEARGFIFGVPVAYVLNAGFVPVRKPGKLPGETVSIDYALEYGTDTLQIHKDVIKPGTRVAIVDDLLATGGTISAVAKLVESLGGIVVGMSFTIELTGLNGRDKLTGHDIDAVVTYEF